MRILKFPHIALSTKCKEIEVFDETLKETLDDMWETMVAAEGMGLAMNQVGILQRAFIMRGPIGERVYCVNPQITSASVGLFVRLQEGCLSAPGELLILNRYNNVVLKYQTESGETKFRCFDGVHAVAVQHELQHLDGISFLESEEIPPRQKRKLVKKWGLN